MPTHRNWMMNWKLIQVTIVNTRFHYEKQYIHYSISIYYTGDLIDVHTKQEDGWWIGAIKDRVGIFPATYVEEIA